MTIIRHSAPDAVFEVLAAGLFASPEGPGWAEDPTVEATEPLPLYTIGTETLLNDGGLDSVQFFGWRSLLLGSGRVRIGDVEARGDELRLAAIASGPAAERMLAAGTVALKAFDGVGTLELGVVESAQLKVAALWLQGEGGGFVPFSGFAMEAMAAGDFVRALTRRAVGQREAFAAAAQEARTRREGTAR